MKYILLIGDGMGDTPVPELGGKTPLEAASKPTIDRLCAAAEPLLVRTVPEGYPPGSDVANLSLLGYEPEKYYTGRAPLEAASMGVAIPDGALAFRCNLVTVRLESEGRLTMLDHSAGHITTPEATELITAVQAACGTDQLRFYPGVSYRHLLIHQGEIPASLCTVPPHDYLDQDVTEFYGQYLGVDYLSELMRTSAQVLAEHPVNLKRQSEGKRPANAIWIWGEGKRPAMNSLQERHEITGSLISAVDLLKGLGVCSGLEVPEVKGATGWLDTNYQGKVDAALDALTRQDFALVHVEAPDEAGHQGSATNKVQAIEDFDAKVVAPIVEEMDRRGEPYRLVVTMDHYTPIARRTHEDWPVPMFLYDSEGVEQLASCSYTEANIIAAAEQSNLCLDSGAAFFTHFVTSNTSKASQNGEDHG
ncbi:phosphoglycerate mutase [Candidatus Electrothrix aarhusensis]|jgi:2,3-bisphosphoglycerate-independent phosphoglycerate mutase|uniref:Phosphoglycerate mutase n=1 Tax=Candidatus Electrothrix aarhusensis TaxID=1859131 RepID=A0A444J0N4_9BACT|nr:phosphoglycerate mutase [Candidatus Electrothrix aarhusensis]